jgi:hypothetical protein
MRPELLTKQPVVYLPVNHDACHGPDKHLCCPVCGFDYTHIAHVQVDQGHVSAEMTDDKVQIRGTGRDNGHRGSEVTLAFYCENGHWFEYSFAFHKGNTSVELHTAHVDQASITTELWRN